MSEAIGGVIESWLSGEPLAGDLGYSSYRRRQQNTRNLFFKLGAVLVVPRRADGKVLYNPVYVGEMDFAGQHTGSSERRGIVLRLGSRLVEQLLTPRITAYEVRPGQTFDSHDFDPDDYRMIRTLDLPPDTPGLPHGSMQYEGRPSPDNIVDVQLFAGILWEMAR